MSRLAKGKTGRRSRPARLARGLSLAAIAVAPACAESAWAGTRATISIELNVLAKEGGKRVYSIPVRFGKTTMQAVLDTGSVPLQILPDQIAPRFGQPTGATYSVTYGGDRIYKGNVETGRVSIGAVSGAIDFGIVTAASCLPSHPTCVIAGEAPPDARFGGNILPGIVGVRRATGNALRNAFGELGVHRYIITAPRLNDTDRIGSLVLDPTSNETSGYVALTNSPAADAPSGSVRGCLRDQTTGVFFCGVVFFDTGATGITVYQPRSNPRNRNVNPTDAGQLEFTDGTGDEIAGVDFRVGFNSVTNVTFADPVGQYAEPFIRVGQLPYLGLNMLTDLDGNGYAVSARPPQRDGTVGHVP